MNYIIWIAGVRVVLTRNSILETQFRLLLEETTEKRTDQKSLPFMGKTCRVYHKKVLGE